MGHVTAEIIERYVREVSRIYGSHLRKIILYGSYARGDFREDSDIDIMILVDLDDSEIKAAGRRLSDVTFDINFDFDVLIMPIVQNAAFSEHWVGAYPFFNQINNEGIELYAA